METRYKECAEIERSIIKKFRKGIWRKFTKALRDYELVKENDSVCVCLSGGKDSAVLAKCMQELKKHGKVNFSVKFLVMDPGYSPANRQLIEKNLSHLNIPYKIFESDIFEAVDTMGGSPCYMCARMRRGHLYHEAKLLGCNKIALGHHFDDVIETILLSIIYGGEVKTMMPKLKSTNFEGMELIRPLYLVKEEEILKWKAFNNLEFLNCACKVTEKNSQAETGSKRKEMKNLISKLRENNPQIDIRGAALYREEPER